ncbi:hypothetical protein ACVWWR_005734 [Bradyrhizobium sp. LM3.2]
MTGDRGRHAEPRIGIDIGGADKALHQLVGDVIVLGQQLAGEIERDRVGAVARDDVLHAVGDVVERIAPGDAFQRALAADHRIEQPAFQPDGLAECRALGAQPAEIGGVVRIARDRCAAPAVWRRQHAAADAAIGAGRLGGAERGIDRRHLRLLSRDARAAGRTSYPCGSPPPFRCCGSVRDTRAHRRYRRSARRR